MSFTDFATAAKFRDVVSTQIQADIERIRPRIRYAVVNTIDRPNSKCTVTYVGDSVPSTVKMGVVQPNATSQIVRIDGPVGDRYISDVLGAAFVNAASIGGTTVLTGDLTISGGSLRMTGTGDSPKRRIFSWDGIELAHPSSTPYIDFHHSANPEEATDYDIRLIKEVADWLVMYGGSFKIHGGLEVDGAAGIFNYTGGDPLRVSGSFAGVRFDDRDDATQFFVAYSTADLWRLYSSTNGLQTFSIDRSGNVISAGSVTANGNLTTPNGAYIGSGAYHSDLSGGSFEIYSAGTVFIDMHCNSNTSDFDARFASSATNQLYIQLGGTNNPMLEMLNVGGANQWKVTQLPNIGGTNLQIAGSNQIGLQPPSNRASKSEIKPLSTVENENPIWDIRPVRFLWNPDAVQNSEELNARNKLGTAGFVLEDVAAYAPDVVFSDSEGIPRSIDANAMMALIVDGLQHCHEGLKRRVVIEGDFDKRIATLEKTVVSLRGSLDAHQKDDKRHTGKFGALL